MALNLLQFKAVGCQEETDQDKEEENAVETNMFRAGYSFLIHSVVRAWHKKQK